MKRIYSAILLISFLVGILQPILPMIEYQLFEGNIIELLCERMDDGEETNIVVQFYAGDQDSTHNTGHDQSLLNDNYYPLGLDTSSKPQMAAFLSISRYYMPTVKNIISPSFLPNPPPPRLS